MIGIGNDDSSASEYTTGHVKLDWLPPSKIDKSNENDRDNEDESKNNSKDDSNDDNDKDESYSDSNDKDNDI